MLCFEQVFITLKLYCQIFNDFRKSIMNQSITTQIGLPDHPHMILIFDGSRSTLKNQFFIHI